jgi:hypothetical protein
MYSVTITKDEDRPLHPHHALPMKDSEGILKFRASRKHNPNTVVYAP